MKYQRSRRDFMRSMLVVPLAASVPLAVKGMSPSFSSPASISGKYGHKFKISLNVYSFNNPLKEGEIDLFDVLDFCAKYNFDAIDPTGYYFPGYPEVPDDKYINDFKRKAFLLGLDISGTGVRNDFADPEKANRESDVNLIKAWVVAAEKLGIPSVRVFAGTHSHEGFTRKQVFEWMAKDLKTCCEFGQEHGVIIAVQNHNDFLKTAADVDQIFEMVDSPWLGLNLDIGGYRQHDPYTEIKQNIKYAVTLLSSDICHIMPIMDTTDFVKLFGIIKDAGYRGYLPIETLGAGDPFKKVPVLLGNVMNAIQIVEE